MEKIAEEIITQLKNKGFTIQRYDSMTSKSIYIKLDYGVSQSIRISDHQGKKHLKYRFNVHTGIEQPYQENDGQFERFYYGAGDIDQLIEDILEHRKRRIIDFGKSSYQYFMQKNKFEGTNKKGFWQSAQE